MDLSEGGQGTDSKGSPKGGTPGLKDAGDHVYSCNTYMRHDVDLSPTGSKLPCDMVSK